MTRIALLTSTYLDGNVGSDQLLADKLNALGYPTTFKCWDDFHDDGEELLVLRSTWDYTRRLGEFLSFCESNKSRLVNSAAVVAWNSNKKYLLELESQGLKTLPMRIAACEADVRQAMEELGGDEFVAKPPVGASGKGMLRFGRDEVPALTEPMIIQKLHEEIYQGEVSLMYFAGKYAFAVIKIPQAGEMRVQSSYGGKVEAYAPSAKLLKLADQAVAMTPEPTVYTRVDVVPDVGVIELECIEPGLFLDWHEDAASRFAEAIIARLG